MVLVEAMENQYGITVANKYALFLNEDEDPLEILKLQEATKTTKKSEKSKKNVPDENEVKTTSNKQNAASSGSSQKKSERIDHFSSPIQSDGMWNSLLLLLFSCVFSMSFLRCVKTSTNLASVRPSLSSAYRDSLGAACEMVSVHFGPRNWMIEILVAIIIIIMIIITAFVDCHGAVVLKADRKTYRLYDHFMCGRHPEVVRSI